jgi:hypothetical protein
MPRSRSLLAVALATCLPLAAQSLTFVVHTPQGTSGSHCDPQTCTPANATASVGDPVDLVLRGAFRRPHWLLVAPMPAQCVALPGFAGNLLVAVTADIVPLDLITGMPGGDPLGCSSLAGTHTVLVPNTLPVGVQVLLQGLAPMPSATGGEPVWTLSNGVVLTIV